MTVEVLAKDLRVGDVVYLTEDQASQIVAEPIVTEHYVTIYCECHEENQYTTWGPDDFVKLV